jgi:uncharacterized membrane protein
MATLTAWEFPTPDGADNAEKILLDLQKQRLITILDAAVVSWPADKKKPRTRQMQNLAGAGALTGAFWGMLFGLLFFVPLLGLAVGAGLGALTGSMADVGISDDFIKSVRDTVKPGTSALFLMTQDVVADRVLPAVTHLKPELITTNLSQDQEDRLRAAFAEE